MPGLRPVGRKAPEIRELAAIVEEVDVDALLARLERRRESRLLSRATRGREREARPDSVSVAVHAPAVHREPVRPVVPRLVAPRPAQRSARAVERVHVIQEVLDVDRRLVGDGSGRVDAQEARALPERESPAHSEIGGICGADGRSGNRARPGMIVVGQPPFASAARRSTADKKPKPCEHRQRPGSPSQRRTDGARYPTGMKVFIHALAATSIFALVSTAQGSAQPRTTAPPPVVTVKVTITDTAIRLSPKRALRGSIGRFILVNRGKKPHTFVLGHERRSSTSAAGGAPRAASR